MEVAVLLFFVWVVVVIVTSRTVVWWVPRLIPAILGIVALSQRESTHGDVGGMQAMANGVLTLFALIMLGLSVITLGARLLRSASRAPAGGFPHAPPPPPPPAIPPAYVVTRGDRPPSE
jgi:hypothetical protein